MLKVMHVILKTKFNILTKQHMRSQGRVDGPWRWRATMAKANISVPAMDQMIKICELSASRFCICMCTTVYYVQLLLYQRIFLAIIDHQEQAN